MAWDDAAPTAEDLAAPDWASTPPTQEELDATHHTLGGFAKNVVSDIKDTASALGNVGERFFDHPVDTTVDTVKAIPGSLMQEGKRLGVGEFLTGHPIKALQKSGQAFYDKPITTALETLPAAAPAGRALGLTEKALPAATEAAAAAEKALPSAAERGLPLASEDLVKMPPSAVGKSATMEAAEDFAKNPPPQTPPTPSAAATNPLSEVNSYLTQKYGQAAANPTFPQNVAKYLQEFGRKMGGKDIGLQGLQIKQMGEGFKGIEKAQQLIDYAREKGYLRPGLTDVARKTLVQKNLDQAGKTVGAIRDIAGSRAKPPLDEMFNAVKDNLTEKYGLKAPGEVEKTLSVIKKGMEKDPTFSGVADVATDLNKELRNIRSMGRHVGPNTDAADLLSRMNNEHVRSVLNAEENDLYTQSLRDFGAHKKLEKALAVAGRKELTGRGAPGTLTNRFWQEMLDRAGYRVAGNVADRTAKAILKDPSKVQSLPKFFEELEHQAEDVVDDSIANQTFAHGGIVESDELNDYLSSKYGPKEK